MEKCLFFQEFVIPLQPLSRNNGSDKTEGASYKNVCCSYFHGPILARNGLLAKRLLLAALKRKYPNDDFSKQEALEIKATY